MTSTVVQRLGDSLERELWVTDTSVASNMEFEVPIEPRGETVYFRPELMAADKPYTFEFLGTPLIAVKRVDGTVDFYQLP